MHLVSQLKMKKSILPVISFLIFGLAGGGSAAASRVSSRNSNRGFEREASVIDRNCDNPSTMDIIASQYASDLAFLREFRDDMLTRAKKGTFCKKLVYIISEKGLKVLHKNPHMIPRARHLIEANQGAISEAMNGSSGFLVYDGDEVVAFLHDYSQEAPLFLKILTCMLRRSIIKRQKKGELVFVSDHNAQRNQQETNTL